jgi:glycosyltransferase involved in cell wall biosynthesis/GT2 family glycosyltransferase
VSNTTSSPDISVVIVSWNSAESLRASLGPLRRSAEAASASLEIVVVDNASADDSKRVAAEAGADRIVENSLNAGYVVAASQGIALARAPWIMLANPDLTVSDTFVGLMLEAARSAPPEVASLVPDIRYAANPAVVNSRGIEVDKIGIPAERDAGRDADRLAGPVEVFGATSSGCLVRRAALVEVGGLEPLYFAYLEDVDVAWRLRKRGYRALVVPGAVALHEGSVSTGEGSWLKAFLVARNRRALFRLHGPLGVSARVVRAVTEIGHATVQALSGSGTASIRGRGAAVRTRRYTSFLRASNRITGIPDDRRVALAPRQTLNEALRRKRSAASLMSRGDGAWIRRARTTSTKRAAVDGTGTRGEEPLKVLVDATNLKPGQGGIRTYTLGLLQGLSRQSELSLVVATSVDDVAGLGPMELVPISPRTQGVAARALWRERNLASLARSLDVDVVLTPVPELPLRRLPVPSVIVVHDVGPLVAPAFYSFPKKLRYQAFLPRTCRLASAVVCVSHATLVGLQAATGTDTRRCEVIGEGPQLLDVTPDHESAEAPYLLYVGSLEPRKNVDTLVTAFASADPPLAARLVIVGPTQQRDSDALKRRVARLGLDDRVLHLGFVSPARLKALYRDAWALVLPSLYEGFGLPVLEAMKSGTPVVASDIAPVREVAGDAVLYVPRPLDADAWRDALARICADASMRAELSDRGPTVARDFSWSHVGRRFSDLLHRVAATGSLASPVPAGTEADEWRASTGPRLSAEVPAGAEPAE